MPPPAPSASALALAREHACHVNRTRAAFGSTCTTIDPAAGAELHTVPPALASERQSQKSIETGARASSARSGHVWWKW